jgi:hypothetical protein
LFNSCMMSPDNSSSASHCETDQHPWRLQQSPIGKKEVLRYSPKSNLLELMNFGPPACRKISPSCLYKVDLCQICLTAISNYCVLQFLCICIALRYPYPSDRRSAASPLFQFFISCHLHSAWHAFASS